MASELYLYDSNLHYAATAPNRRPISYPHPIIPSNQNSSALLTNYRFYGHSDQPVNMQSDKYSPESLDYGDETSPCLRPTSGDRLIMNGQQSIIQTHDFHDTRSTLMNPPSTINGDQIDSNDLIEPGRGFSGDLEALQEEPQVWFRVDKRNCCIFFVLLVTLLIGVAILAFILGNYLAMQRQRTELDSLLPNGTNQQRPNSESPTFPDDDFTIANDSKVDISNVYPSDFTAHHFVSPVPSENITFAGVYRLPTDLIPEHYDVYLDLTRFVSHQNVWGTVTVTSLAQRTTNKLSFNAAAGLNIANVELWQYWSTNDAKMPIAITNWTHDTRMQQVHVIGTEPMIAGQQYRIRVDYDVDVTCSLESGFMCIFGQTSPGNKPHVEGFTTKFEPALAKTVLPCWDEPQMKAIFNVTLRYPRGLIALSNTAIHESRVDQHLGHVTSYYFETPPMSTYLLSFAMGNFVSLETETERGLPLTIYCRPHLLNSMRYASEFATRTLDRMEEYFQLKYPMSKLDFVATPFYSAAAMENWGLVVFSERLLVVDDEYTANHSADLSYRFGTEKIIVHELLHQWFGNLVTLDWWTEIWLNEGVATYFIARFLSPGMQPYLHMEQLESLVYLWQTDVTGKRASVYQRDTSSERQLDALFISNVYVKGGLTTSILEEILGEQQFRKRIVDYLMDNQYSSVNHTHMWKAMGQLTFANETVDAKDLMHGWLHHVGLPALHVHVHRNQSIIHFQQQTADANFYREFIPKTLNENFLFKNTTTHSSAILSYENLDDNQLWTIPITISTQYGLTRTQDLMLMQQPITIEQNVSLLEEEWLLVNPNLRFPLRVNYDEATWRALIGQLYAEHLAIPERSRVQMMLDAKLFMMESTQITVYIELLGYLRHETATLPLVFGIDAIDHLISSYQSSSVYQLLLVYFKPIILAMKPRLDNDTHLRRTMTIDHVRVLDWLYCLVGGRECQPLPPRIMTGVLDVLDGTAGAHDVGYDSGEYPANPGLMLSYSQFYQACFSIGRHSHLYRNQIDRLLAELERYGGMSTLHSKTNRGDFVTLAESAHSDLGYGLSWRTQLAICATAANEHTLKRVSKLPFLYKTWQRLTIDASYAFTTPTARKLLWTNLYENRHHLSMSLRLNRNLLHSVRNLHEWRIAVRVFSRTLLADMLYLRAKLNWYENEAQPILRRWLMEQVI